MATNKLDPAPYIDHWILQLQGVESTIIESPDGLIPPLSTLIEQLGLTRVSDHFHFFDPGVSAVVILAESHLSIHTWPELGFLHADIVTCTKILTEKNLRNNFADAFSPSHIQIDQLDYQNGPAGER